MDDLLQIARIESGHIELRKQPVDLVKAVSLAIEESRHLFDDRKQKLLFSFPRIQFGSWRTRCDSNKSRRTFYRMLPNILPQGARSWSSLGTRTITRS